MAGMKFGAQLWSQQTTWPEFRDAALAAEANGWDSVWTWDHLLAIFGPWEQPILEGWSTLSATAAVTSRVRLGLMVGANTFRNPGLTAKLATTLDNVSDGRAVLGIGGAWFEREHEAFGIPDWGSGFGERLDRLDESVMLMRRLLRRRAGDARGPVLRDDGCALRTAPDPGQAADPHRRLRARRRPCERPRSGPTPGIPPARVDEVAAKLAILDEHCADVGRDRGEIELTVSFPMIIRDDAADAEAAYASILAHNGSRGHGPGAVPARLADEGRRRAATLPGPRVQHGHRRGCRTRTTARRSSGSARSTACSRMPDGPPQRRPGSRAGWGSRRGQAGARPPGPAWRSADGRRQHRRRPRASRAPCHARPRHRHVHPRRGREPGARLGRRGRDVRGGRDARPVRRADLVPAR